MVEPLFSRINLIAVLVCLLLAACARPAPELPSHQLATAEDRQIAMAKLSPEDRALNCKQISDEQKAIASKTKKLNEVIKADRTYNQVAGYAGGGLGLVVAKHHESEKKQLDALQRRKDQLILLSRLKRC